MLELNWNFRRRLSGFLGERRCGGEVSDLSNPRVNETVQIGEGVAWLWVVDRARRRCGWRAWLYTVDFGFSLFINLMNLNLCCFSRIDLSFYFVWVWDFFMESGIKVEWRHGPSPMPRPRIFATDGINLEWCGGPRRGRDGAAFALAWTLEYIYHIYFF